MLYSFGYVLPFIFRTEIPIQIVWDWKWLSIWKVHNILRWIIFLNDDLVKKKIKGLFTYIDETNSCSHICSFVSFTLRSSFILFGPSILSFIHNNFFLLHWFHYNSCWKFQSSDTRILCTVCILYRYNNRLLYSSI